MSSSEEFPCQHFHTQHPTCSFLIFVVLLVLADVLTVSGDNVVALALGAGRGGRRGLGEEWEAEGGRGRAFTGRAAARAVTRTDGLQHAAFPFLQHVLLHTLTHTNTPRQEKKNNLLVKYCVNELKFLPDS